MKHLLRRVRLSKVSHLLSSNTFSTTILKPTLNPPAYTFASVVNHGLATTPLHHKNVIKSSYEGSGYYVEQMLTGCLAIYSYYIQSGDECILIDPLFDISEYNQLIEQRGKKLTAIFVSHYHADYVSGQYELQKQHNCKIFMGPTAQATQFISSLKDQQRISLGNVILQCWHTPGHTEESSCLVVLDQKGKRDTIFTGDTLFLNQVGRPDLAVKTDLTAADLANLLYTSLQKLKTLNDDLRIYPGHGSGSSCGKSIGAGDFFTLGKQKQNNYALKAEDKDSFVKQVLEEMPNPPPYFGYNAQLNKFEPFFYEEANKTVKQHLSVEQVWKYSQGKDVVMLDVREANNLTEGIIKGSIWVGFDGAFANYVGTLFNSTDRFILYGSGEEAKQAITRLFRIGYINIIGYANFTIQEWKEKKLPFVVPEFVDEVIQPGTTVLDVRRPSEWKNEGIVEGATTCELAHLFKDTSSLDSSKTYVTHCRSGYRAKIAWSYLLASGFKVKACTSKFVDFFNSGKANISKI